MLLVFVFVLVVVVVMVVVAVVVVMAVAVVVVFILSVSPSVLTPVTIRRLVAETAETMASACAGRLPGFAAASLGFDPKSFGEAEQANCFHILGFDVLPTAEGDPYLLEVNCNPSFGVDSVWPQVGPNAEAPVEPRQGAPWGPLWELAKQQVQRCGPLPAAAAAHLRHRRPAAADDMLTRPAAPLRSAPSTRTSCASACRTTGRTCTGDKTTGWSNPFGIASH